MLESFPWFWNAKWFILMKLRLHTYFVGEILDVKAEENVLHQTTGLPDMEKIKPILFGPEIRTYHGVGALQLPECTPTL